MLVDDFPSIPSPPHYKGRAQSIPDGRATKAIVIDNYAAHFKGKGRKGDISIQFDREVFYFEFKVRDVCEKHLLQGQGTVKPSPVVRRGFSKLVKAGREEFVDPFQVLGLAKLKVLGYKAFDLLFVRFEHFAGATTLERACPYLHHSFVFAEKSGETFSQRQRQKLYKFCKRNTQKMPAETEFGQKIDFLVLPSLA